MINGTDSPEEMRENFEPDWGKTCNRCKAIPTVPISGLCGPCHWGISDTMAGDWWDERSGELNWDLIDP